MNSIQISLAVICTLLWLANPTTSHPGAPPKAALKAPDTKPPAAKPQNKPASSEPAKAPAGAAKPSAPQGADKNAALNKDISAVAHLIEGTAVVAPVVMVAGAATAMEGMEGLMLAPMAAAVDIAKIGMDVGSMMFGGLSIP